MKNRELVGVAVVAWNNADILPVCLDSIKKQTYKQVKTIVLDNNSEDNTVELVKKQYPWVKLLKSKTNSGFSKGNNTIVNEFLKDKHISYIVLLNSDATLHPSWIENLVDYAQEKQKVAFLQGLTLDYFDHQTIDSTHIYISRNGQAIQGGYRKPYMKQTLEGMRVFGVNAAACMVARDFLEAQPFGYLFDENFFMYLEDADAMARSVVMGWNNYFVPEAVAYHMGSASSGKNPGFSVYMVNRNILPTLYKNFPLIILALITPRLIMADAREMYRILRGKNYMVLKKYIWGRIVGVFAVLKYAKKRRLIIKRKAVSIRSIWALMKSGAVD